jgi:hypothetical protein
MRSGRWSLIHTQPAAFGIKVEAARLSQFNRGTNAFSQE